MDNADKMIRLLEPEIEEKCAEIRRRRSEKLLQRVFIALAAVLLTVPAALIFMGVSLAAVFVPLVFAAVVILAVLPVMLGGAENYEQVQ